MRSEGRWSFMRERERQRKQTTMLLFALTNASCDKSSWVEDEDWRLEES